jgi:hypothetical protein
MNQDALTWCLGVVAVIAVAAVVVLVARSRALGRKKQQAEEELTRRLNEVGSQLAASEAELGKYGVNGLNWPHFSGSRWSHAVVQGTCVPA